MSGRARAARGLHHDLPWLDETYRGGSRTLRDGGLRRSRWRCSGGAACSSGQARAPAGTAATTASESGAYTPDSLVLYVARREIAGACGDDLSPTLELAPDQAELSPSQKVEIEKWALCLQRPELRDARVVLVQPRVAESAGRAQLLRDELAARGVDPARVSVAAAPANGERAVASPNDVRVELARSPARPLP